MDFKNYTTHVVIKFNKKLNGKDCIDLIPISWTLINDGLLQCKYPDKNEYSKIDMLSKTSSNYKDYWKSFGISVVSEAQSYEQGVGQMNRAFSSKVVLSSTVEDMNSSENKCQPKHLSGDELKRHLRDIPPFKKSQSASSLSNSSSKSTNWKILLKKSSKKKRVRSHDELDDQLDSDAKSEEMLVSTKKIRIKENKFVKRIQSYENTNLPTVQERSIDVKYSHVTPKIATIYCPTCGCSDEDLPVSKSDMESLRRSIEYRIKEESKNTRTLLATVNSSSDLSKIMKDALIDLPKFTLDRFKDFGDQLNNDIGLIKNLECFMVINIRGMVKISENLTTIIPKIMTKDVQIKYSAFSRETNGIKKLNFSETNTCKYLLEVLVNKFPEVREKEFSCILSRWFSGAKDRDVGKKERMAKKAIPLSNSKIT